MISQDILSVWSPVQSLPWVSSYLVPNHDLLLETFQLFRGKIVISQAILGFHDLLTRLTPSPIGWYHLSYMFKHSDFIKYKDFPPKYFGKLQHGFQQLKPHIPHVIYNYLVKYMIYNINVHWISDFLRNSLQSKLLIWFVCEQCNETRQQCLFLQVDLLFCSFFA